MADDRSAEAGSRSRRGLLMVVAALVLVAAGVGFSRQFTAAPAAPSTDLPTRSSEPPAPEAPAPAPRPSEAAAPGAPTADASQPDTAKGSATEDCEEEPPPTSFTLAECDSGAEPPAKPPSSAPASP